MVKCKKCGDFISDEFEICYECKNSTDEEIKKRLNNNRFKKIWKKLSWISKLKKNVQADTSWEDREYLFKGTNWIAKKLSISNIYSRAILFNLLAMPKMLIFFGILSIVSMPLGVIGMYISYIPLAWFFIYTYQLYYSIYKRILVSNINKLIKTSLLLVLFSPLIYIGIYLPILFFLSYNGYLN